MNGKLNFVAIALLAGMFISCETENLPVNNRNYGKVGVVLSDDNGMSTKSVEAAAEFIGSYPAGELEGMELRIDAYVSDNEIIPFSDEVQTKGSIVSTGGANGTVNINASGSQFVFHGWLGSANREEEDSDFHFIGTTATKGSDAWSLGGEYKWRNSVPTSFWSYYPTGISGVNLPSSDASDSGQKQVGFSYTTPLDASAQKDILFAYNLHTVSYDDDGESSDSEFVNVRFYHALAAIRFDIAEALKDGVTITDVFFKNIITDGTCAISGTPGASNDASGSVAFAWTPGSTRKTISQSVTSSDFTATGLDGTTANALMPLNSSKFFFFIPQAVSSVELGIKYKRSDGLEHEISTTISHDPWQAGKIYTYRLNPADDVLDVDVQDEVTDDIKTNVTITNTGNLAGFIRAAVAAYWVKEIEGSEYIVKACDFTTEGTLTGLGSDWLKGADGYYYYKYGVKGGTATNQAIFTSYQAGDAPVEGAYLQMSILAQIVDDRTAWDTVPTGLSTDIED